jgi:DNA-binding CsgD family transcriptional regulator/tetratricopeptide (TPR) repeat protein
LQWADAETLAVLDYLADNVASEGLLVLCTVRDGGSPAVHLVRRIQQRGGGDVIDLGPLNVGAVAAMVRACLPSADDGLVSRVQATSRGVPLLVEELLASPGIPASVGAAVHARVSELTIDEQRVVRTAAILGVDFDWRVLEPITGLPAAVVAAALDRFVDALLLEIVGDEFRFRHALFRDAVVHGIAPPAREALARSALGVLEDVRPGGDYADLAVQAGERTRAAIMLASAGATALQRGAPGTAVQRLRQAVELAADPAVQHQSRVALVKALALTGRLDEATAVAEPLLGGAGRDYDAAAVHLDLAAAAVAATRWAQAAHHLDAATTAVSPPGGPRPLPVPDGSRAAQIAVLSAEIALASGDVRAARDAAGLALDAAEPAGAPEMVCHALELIGRSQRLQDLDSARTAFQRAYEVADRAELAVWRLRALHELGTIDLLDRGGAARLLEARAIAEKLGMLSTAAVLDLQLAGAYLQQFDLESALGSMQQALSMSSALRLDRLQASAYVFEACIEALRGDRNAVERAAAAALRLAPEDAEVVGLTSTGAIGVVELLWGSRTAALVDMDRGMATLHMVANSPPGPYRGLWPLVVAVHGRADAVKAVDDVRRSGVAVNRINRGYLAYADAVLDRSTEAVDRGDDDLTLFPVWRHIGRALVGEAALRDDWGDPSRWLADARECFAHNGLTHLVRHVDQLLEPLDRWTPPGVSARESEVLTLVAAGLPNREIAERLRLSIRTVEKHVESLLRKATARSRTELAAMVRDRSMGGNTHRPIRRGPT